MTNEQIIAAGQQIYDETEVGANTSERIGGVIRGIGQRLATRDTEVDEALTQLANQNAGIDAKNGYYTNSQAASESALTVTAPEYVLSAGGNIRIKMAHSKSVSSVTLNINGTGAKALYYNGEPVSPENTWQDNETIVVYYDGEKYLATNSLGGGGGNGDAENVHYDNTESGLSATNAQDAIDSIADKTQRLTTLDIINTNLVNPSEIEQGIHYTSAGAQSTYQNFATSGYIPVEKGKTYTLYAPLANGEQGNPVTISAFDSNKNSLGYLYGKDSNSTGGTRVYTVKDSWTVDVKYIRITGVSNTSAGSSDAYKLFGCFEGEDIPFEEWHEASRQLQYNDRISFEDKDDDTLVNKGDVIEAITPLQEGIEELQDVKDVADMLEKYSDVTTNLVVPSEIEQDIHYTSAGARSQNQNFATSGYIPVEKGKTYTLYAPLANGGQGNPVTICAFDSNKNSLGYLYGKDSNSTGGTHVYTVKDSWTVDVKYIRITGASNTIAGNDVYKLFGCFEGEDVPFEEWHEAVQTVLINDDGDYDNKPLNAITTKSDVIRAIEKSKEQDTSAEGVVKFRYEAISTEVGAAGTPSIKIYDNDNNYILASLDKKRNAYYGGNHIFNFLVIKYNGVTNIVGDDVPPLIYFPTSQRDDYGGNHAASVTRLNAPNHGLNNTDIGKTFVHSDGFNVVLMRVVDADNIIISRDGTRPGTVPNGEITINNTNYTISTSTANSPYLCPVEQNLTQTILLNGKEEVTEDGDYTCDYLDIVEDYDVNMPTEIIGVIKDRIKDGVGSPDDPSYVTPNSLFHIRNTYRFLPNMGCIIFKTFTAETNINVYAIMCTQSTYSFHWKINNVEVDTMVYLPNSTHNQNTIVPSSSQDKRNNENIYVAPTLWDSSKYMIVDDNTWADQNNPVNRVICKTPAGTANQSGYVVGYDRSLGVGKSLGNYTNAPINLSNDGKIYPHGLKERILNEGDSVTIVMYRMYFRPDLQPEGRICEYHYELNGKLVVYLDYSDSINDVIVIDDKWDNKPIEVVESRRVTLLTDMYNGGIRVRSSYVNGETSFMVVRVG